MTKIQLLQRATKINYDYETIIVDWITPRKIYHLMQIVKNDKVIYVVDIITYMPSKDKVKTYRQLFTFRGLAEWYIERTTIKEAVVRFIRIQRKGRFY